LPRSIGWGSIRSNLTVAGVVNELHHSSGAHPFDALGDTHLRNLLPQEWIGTAATPPAEYFIVIVVVDVPVSVLSGTAVQRAPSVPSVRPGV